ncbi:MAG TPA: hypothetical protein DIU15_11490 [Deltaproteobacteria bacterium]|nr:hypothetical protein [Deltaproteobacteria bacterium]HCP46661.1 hypothetical protein [Deltaproteobacteria bacterium]
MTTTSISVQAAQDHPLPDHAPGDRIGGHYEVIEKLGDGMLGAVYKVKHEATGEVVALKLIRPQLVAEDIDINRFNHELQIAKGFDHPGIVKLLDSGEADGTLYLTSELIEGESLRDLITKYRSRGEDLPLDEVHEILDEVLEALKHAHGTTIHRDLKPENILLYDVPDKDGQLMRKVKVSDFAIANVVSPTIFATSYLNRENAFYLAPEMSEFRDKTAPNSDLYSVGAILYEMLLGYPPTGVYEMPSDIRSGEVPNSIDDFVEIALAPNPQDRFQRCEDMQSALEQAFSEVYLVSETNMRRTLLLLLLLAAALMAAGVYFQQSKPTPEEILASDYRHRDAMRERIKMENGQPEKAPAIDPNNPDHAKYAGMQYVPAGQFIRGKFRFASEELTAMQGKGELDEQVVQVDGFWIDQYEMHYAPKEVLEEDSEALSEEKTRWNENTAYGPVREVTWTEAKAECERLSKRLCTEDEWEKACKGPSNSIYAYGDDPAITVYNPQGSEITSEGICLESGFKRGDKVNSLPACKSAYGVSGMSGGVAEWTSTQTPDGKNYIVKPGPRGGDALNTRCSGRNDRPPTFSQIHVGARCCAD